MKLLLCTHTRGALQAFGLLVGPGAIDEAHAARHCRPPSRRCGPHLPDHDRRRRLKGHESHQAAVDDRRARESNASCLRRHRSCRRLSWCGHRWQGGGGGRDSRCGGRGCRCGRGRDRRCGAASDGPGDWGRGRLIINREHADEVADSHRGLLNHVGIGQCRRRDEGRLRCVDHLGEALTCHLATVQRSSDLQRVIVRQGAVGVVLCSGVGTRWANWEVLLGQSPFRRESRLGW